MRDFYESIYGSYPPPPAFQGDHLKKTSNSNVFGRFLKLGKSKSDANSSGVKSRARPASFQDDLEEDFRLTTNKCPVERMVHKVNSRKDVSRSHSWIYGSVKLPSDLPFGYGYSFAGPTGNNMPPPRGHPPMDYCGGSCDCSTDFDFLPNPNPSGHPPSNFEGNCQACYPHNSALPPQCGKRNCGQNGGHHQQQPPGGEKRFANSVRKLTWKSLKQAVKKRPTLDVLKKPPAPPPPPETHPIQSSSHDDLLNANYFFPEKKTFYASCTDLYGETNNPHVTASVRVRPKRSRQPWPFPNEFGPVPNYQEEEIYHSEWDLRQFIPYDVWLAATNQTKIPKANRNSMETAGSSNYNPEPGSYYPPANPVYVPTSNSGYNANPSYNDRSSHSSQKPPPGSAIYGQAIVKRSSILQTDVTAYQLIKSTHKKQHGKPEQGSISDSDELSDNVISEDPVRIGGQGIYMIPNAAPNFSSPHPFPNNAVMSNFTSSSASQSESKTIATPRKVDDRAIQKPSQARKESQETSSSAQATTGLKTYLSQSVDTYRNPLNKRAQESDNSSDKYADFERFEVEEPDVNKYGALKRRKRSKQAVLKETIYEEESDHSDEWTKQEVYAVKIVVSHNSEYVKPILKKEKLYEATPSSENGALPTEAVSFPDETGPRTAKKVQFDHSKLVVCGGLSEEDESDDTLVKESDWIVEEESNHWSSDQSSYASSQSKGSELSRKSSCEEKEDVKDLKQFVKRNQKDGDGTVEPKSRTETTTTTTTTTTSAKVEAPHKNETSQLEASKARRIANVVERKAAEAPNDVRQKIINPNSLLFHDTTRIRLNQSRPSLEQTFKLNLHQPSHSSNQGSKVSRVKQSSSFRHAAPGPLRPKEPPPPPPVLATNNSRGSLRKSLTSSSHSASFGLSTSKLQSTLSSIARIQKPNSAELAQQNRASMVLPARPPAGVEQSQSKVPRRSKSLAEKCKALEKVISSTYQQVLEQESSVPKVSSGKEVGKGKVVSSTEEPRHSAESPYSRRKSEQETPSHKLNQNIEIVTKDNSVSEIRIYSSTQQLNITANAESSDAKELRSQKDNKIEEVHYAATDILYSKQDSRSTSVVLIVSPEQEPAESPSNQSQVEEIVEDLSVVSAEPLYDDVLTKQSLNLETKSKSKAQSKVSSIYRKANNYFISPPPPPPPPPVPLAPPPNNRIYAKNISNSSDSPSLIKSKEARTNSSYGSGLGRRDEENIIYDDTLSLISSSYGVQGRMNDMDLMDDDEPLYDDVLNLLSQDSDSGAETEDSPPPPLPAQGPPLHLLPKVSTQLPVLNFPLLSNSDKVETKKRASEPGKSDSTKIEDKSERKDELVLDRTRSLLNELNDKLTKLNFGPDAYSTYVSKVVISSSSESSGVEEDYNSEKNYSLSNGSDDNYKLTAVSKLVTDTISLARGKFLDSMKSSAVGGRPSSAKGDTGDAEEPIYEEIGDLKRSTSPIYADAFDAKSIFDGASKNEILSFLESIRDRLAAAESVPKYSDSASSSLNRRPDKSRKSVEIERNDSGIGSESGSLVAVSGKEHGSEGRHHPLCRDCNDAPVDIHSLGSVVAVASSSSTSVPGGSEKDSDRERLCRSCRRKRSERKEILQEIYETELKYGRDLKIIEDEFYNPIQIAGLLTKEQLDQIFLNVDQLVEINCQLTLMLKFTIDEAVGTGDEDLTGVNMGKIFSDYGETMMCAFENYCTRQASAGALLTQLEKEKELLRIFLRVSQMENAVLRRMNLPAFLMVPVQRVTRYPLLLARLLKVTPMKHESRAELYAAQVKIEQHLEHMNKTTREVASIKLWRRISIINGSSTPLHRRSNSDLEGANVRIRKMALDVLDWANFTDVSCVIESQLNMVHLNGKALRNIYGCLLARGKDLESLAMRMDQDVFFPPSEDVVKDVKLVLVRVKNTRFCLLREPLCLSKCVISQGENEFQDFIEINEIITKNTVYFQGMDKGSTMEWLRLLQCHAVCVGQWRRRRGALANIMMNGMIRHL